MTAAGGPPPPATGPGVRPTPRSDLPTYRLSSGGGSWMYTRYSIRMTYAGGNWAAMCWNVVVMKWGWNDSQAVARSRYGFIPGKGDGMGRPPVRGPPHCTGYLT